MTKIAAKVDLKGLFTEAEMQYHINVYILLFNKFLKLKKPETEKLKTNKKWRRKK